jgi:histone H3/H4
MAFCEKHRRQHLDSGCSKCWEEDARAKAKPAASKAMASTARVANAVANKKKRSTYQHRDVDKRRAYMRQYMAERRGVA